MVNPELPFRTALVLAPHTDDGEFGCGGAMARLSAQGCRVIYAAFSAAEQSVLPHLPRDILRTEVVEATAELGVAPEDCLVFDFEVRRFPEFRQAILDQLIVLNRRFNPDVVFLPSVNDTHQDHHTIAHEGFRAFKRTTMLAYEVPWNNLDFRTSGFVAFDQTCLDRKMAAIAKYRSQAGRPYANPDFLRSLALTRGVQVGNGGYAETFEVVRWIMN